MLGAVERGGGRDGGQGRAERTCRILTCSDSYDDTVDDINPT